MAGRVLNSVWPKGKPFGSYKDVPKLPASLGGSRENALRSSISHRFWRREFTPPPDNNKGFSLLQLDFFAASLFPKGEKRNLPANSQYALLPWKREDGRDFREGLCKTLKSANSTIYQNEEVPDKIFLKDCFSRGPFPGFAGQKPPMSFQS